MALVLILDAGLASERAFPLEPGETTIGRTDDNGVFVLDKSLSRRHARLAIDGQDAVAVEDLGSRNGTWVNGARVDRGSLRPGDRLRCGKLTFTLRRRDSSLSPTMPAAVRKPHAHLAATPMGELLSSRLNSTDSAGRARDQLHILLRVSQLLSSPEPIEALLDRILDLLLRILDVDVATLLMVEPETGELAPRLTRRSPRLPSTSEEAAESFSRRVVDYVRDQRVAALFVDAENDRRLEGAQSIVAQAIRASMCAPLVSKDELLGVLYVDNRTAAHPFSPEDLDFFTAFANQSAIAIENARLGRRLEEEAVTRNNLLRFFPPATIRRVLDSDGAALAPIEADVTVLFADISGFTALSEALAPRAVIDLLNEYFPPMAEIVARHEGTLEKYIGDALLAVWGAPFAHPDDAERAVAAAVDMQRAVGRLNERWMAKLGRRIEIHVGLNSGPVAAGNIGSERYLQYATIGDATNVAGRICGEARAGEILISQSCLDRIGERPVPVEPLPPLHARGRAQPLSVYRVRWQ